MSRRSIMAMGLGAAAALIGGCAQIAIYEGDGSVRTELA